MRAGRFAVTLGSIVPESSSSKPGSLKATLNSLAMRFFAIDLKSLAAFRIGLASLLLLNLALRARDLEAFYTDAGVLPRSALPAFAVSGIPSWSLYSLSGDLPWQSFLFVVSAVFAIALGLGWRTTLATMGSWFLLVSLGNRNPLVLTGGDLALKLALFWSMFLPLGRVWSLDARAELGDRFGASRAVFCVASAALLLQVAVIYPVAATFKWREPVWRSLEAFGAAMSVEGVATSFGQALAQIPHLPETISAATLLFEGFAVLIAFSPWQTSRLRIVSVALFAVFHLLGPGATFRVGYFPLVMTVLWIPFLPALFWERVAAYRGFTAKGVSSQEVPNPAPLPLPLPLPPIRASLATNAVAAALLLAVSVEISFSLGWVGRGNLLVTEGIRPTALALGLAQKWSLWSLPPTNRYFLVTAELADGREMDVRRDGAAVDWLNPPRRSRNSNWWKLELGLSAPDGVRGRRGYGCFWLGSWRKAHAEEPRPIHVQGWMLEGTWPEVAAGQGRRHLLWTAEDEADWLRRGGTRERVYPCVDR